MSAQSGKKKRLGSRRRGGNQSETSEPNEFHVKDSTSVAQANIPEENTESLNLLSNPDYSQLETKHPPSPEFTGNRRKLGSSRRSKGRQHVKDSVTEPYDKPREEVEENSGNETLEPTQMSPAIQPERQTELSQGNEHDMYVTHDSSLYSVTTPGYSSEVQNTSTSGVGMESLIPKNENLQAEHDQRETDCKVVSDSCKLAEIMLRGMDKSDSLESAEVSDQVKENAHHVGTSEFNSSSLHLSPTVDQQLIDQSKSGEMPGEELPSVYSVTDTKNKKRDDNTDLLRQDGNVEGNYLVSESFVKSEDREFSATPGTTTDKSSLGENTEIEQATFPLPTEKLSTNEELNEHFNLNEVRDSQHSEDAEHKQEVKATQMQAMHQIDYSSESVTHDATEKSDTCSENLIDQAEIRDTYPSELSVKNTDDSATKQEVSNPDDKQDEHAIKENNMEALNQTNEDDHVSDTKEPWMTNIAPCQVYEGEGQVEDDIKPSAEQTVHQEMEGLLYKVEERESHLQNLQSEINAPLDSQPQDHSVSVEEQTDTCFNPIGNRRKMGSSRRNKGRQHIKDSVAKSYHEPTEEVVENMRGSEAFETTETSLATEPIWQEELSQESEPEMTHDNSLYSATTPGYSSEVQNLTTTNHPETVLEGLIPKSGNLQTDDDGRQTDNTVVSDVCESVETMLEEIDKSDTHQTEEISDQVKETSHLVGISALTSINVHSSSTVDQHLNDQSNSREMSNEELPSVYSVTDTENKETDDDTNLLWQDGNLQVNYLTCKSHVESEDTEFSTTTEVTTDKTSFGENTEIEFSVEQATFSLPTEELSTNDEINEQFNLSEVKDAQHSENAVNKEHKQEVKAPQMQEMHQIDYSSESVIHDATEKSDTCSENLIDQAEIRDTYPSELSVKNTDDSATKQEVSNPDDKQDEHPIKESDMEALNQTNDDDHVSNTKEPWMSNIAPCQVYEGEGQVEDDIKPSAVKTVHHQVKEGILSEFEECKSSLQTQQSEINAPLDSQLQDDSVSIEEQTDTSFKPIGNRRKIGSSRRNKGRRHIKDPVAESYHEPTEEAVGNTRDSEALEAMKKSLIIEATVEKKSVETMLEEMDKLETSQTDEVSDQVKENAQEMPNEELPDVYSITYTENKERDEDTELLDQHGNLQSNYLVSDSHVKSAKNQENTEIVYCAEKAMFSSPNGELSTNEEQNEHFNLAQVRGAQHSEDTVHKVHEQEVKPTQRHEMDQIDYSSVKEGKSSLHTLQSTHSSLDSPPQDDSVSIKAQTHTGFNPTVSRRKMGSSRRHKGRQPVKHSVAWGDEAFETMKMSSATETTRQEEFKEHTDPGLNPTEEIRRICLTANEEDNTDNMQEEDAVLSENVVDNSAMMTTDITSSLDKDDSVKSNKEVNEKEKKPIEEPTIKMDSPEVSVWKEDSDIQSISYHGNNVTTGSSALDVLMQEEAFQIQNMEAISSDKESLTNNMMETEEDVMAKDTTETRDNYNTEEEGSINVHVSGQDEVGEKYEDHTGQEINTSHEVSHAELLFADTLAPLDIGHEGNLGAEPAVDVSEDSGISNADGAHKSQQGTQENSDYSENLQIKSKQRRRKMGSTRRNLKRKQEEEMNNKDETEESDSHTESDIRNLDKAEEVAKVPMIVTTDETTQNENAKLSLSTVHEEQQEMNEASTVQDQEQTVRRSTSDLHITESNMISGIDDLMALLPEQSASFSEEVVNAIKCFQIPDIGDSNVVVSVETSPVDDVTSTKTFCGTTQSDEKGPKDINVIQGQDANEEEALKQTTEAPGVAVADLEIVKSVIRGGAEEEHKNAQAEPKDMNEGAHNTDFEMKNSSPNLNPTSRRRKMGSTRRNLRTISKGEDLHQKQEVDNEATETNVGDAMTERVSGIKEKELQLQKEHKDVDSEPGKEKVFETVEYSHTGDSYTKPPGHQTFEENPAVSGQLVETEHHLTPDDIPVKLATSPKHDAMSESAYGGRRRKMGSHRKSHGHQPAREDRTIYTETGRDIKTITDESGIKTLEEHREESELIESDKKSSSNISISNTGGPVSEKTSVHLGQESQKSLSLADNTKGANSYAVVMVGDSSVGKTSYMKRARSGKFSFDLPASVGIDSCLWTVVVDGKPVVLQLWDTAGQERFHSITRQIFHKAQAFLLMYDITSSQSFSAVRYWTNCIKEGAVEDVTILLLGNKSDLAERQVATQEGEILAKEYNFDFMECSAATGENVVQSLEIVARLLSQKVDTRKEAVVLHQKPLQKKSGCC